MKMIIASLSFSNPSVSIYEYIYYSHSDRQVISGFANGLAQASKDFQRKRIKYVPGMAWFPFFKCIGNNHSKD